MGNRVALRKIKARYGAMTVFANDTGAVTPSLLLYGEWAQREIEFITGLFGPGATVLDVGAYIGTHTLAFAHRVGASGLVLSFEAQPRSFELLERNVAANHLSQVRLHHAAVSDVVGEIEFPPMDPSQKGSFGSASLAAVLRGQGGVASNGHATVTAITIDALELARCDFIKMDVEDSEDLVIKGATHTIDRCRPLVYAECNSVDAGVRISEVLRSHDYELLLHLVPAFNPDNFTGERQNIFGTVREAAILGLPPGRQLPAGGPGPADMLLPLKTVDDLVLGLLNKPQYVGEVLAKTPAIQFTEPIVVGRLDDEKLPADNDAPRAATDELRAPQSALKQAQALAEERSLEIGRVDSQLQATQAALQGEQNLTAARQAEIAHLQVRLEEAQIELQSAKAHAAEQQQAAEAERAKSRAALLQASLARRSADAALSALREHEAIAAERILELGRLQAALDRADVTACETREALADAQTTMGGQKAELERIRSALTEAEATGSERSAKLERMQDALGRAKARTAEDKAELERMRVFFVRAEKFARERESEIEQLRFSLQRAEAQANAVLSSTSWHLTAPVRQLRRLVRRR